MTISRSRAIARTLSALSAIGLMLAGAGSAAAATEARTADVNGYHLHANVEKLRFEQGCNGMCFGARVQAYSRFEKAGSNDRKDADYNAVSCRDSYGRTDHDSEHDASKTTVTFTTSPAPPGSTVTVWCDHTSQYKGVTYTTTTDIQLVMPYAYP